MRSVNASAAFCVTPMGVTPDGRCCAEPLAGERYIGNPLFVNQIFLARSLKSGQRVLPSCTIRHGPRIPTPLLAGQTYPSVVAFQPMYLPSTGMPQGHYASFQAAAEELELIVVVRNTNPRSKMWIERGYPPKPMTIKCHTSKKTGKVTAVTPAEIAQCRTAGFYVIDADGVARR